MRDPAQSNRLRIGRVSEVDRGYLLTTVTDQRTPVFTDLQFARIAIAEMRACDEAGLSKTISFVVMPDHVHWLLQLRAGDISSLMQRFKSRSASCINRANGRSGSKFWQAGFHDHAIRDGEDIRYIARYIVANPVRAGLVEVPGQYPHWDAMWL